MLLLLMSVSYYSVLRFSLNFSSLTVVLEIVFVLLGLQYKHIWVKGEYTLPHFGQIQPCCPNSPLYGLIALDSCFILWFIRLIFLPVHFFTEFVILHFLLDVPHKVNTKIFSKSKDFKQKHFWYDTRAYKNFII